MAHTDAMNHTRMQDIVRLFSIGGISEVSKKYPKITAISTIDRYRRQLETTENRELSAVEITGVTPSFEKDDPDGILKYYTQRQVEIERKVKSKYSQIIEIKDNRPVLLAFFSDIHLGNTNCDYKQFQKDVELVSDNDGVYGLGCGDYVDNWIGKLEGIQRHQAMSFDEELVLLQWFIERQGESLIALLSGNHEARTPKIAGIDFLKFLVKGKRLLYDSDEILFTLKLGQAEWRTKMRHKWRGHSKYNETHPMESEIKFGDYLFDIGIGGHTHNGTLMRPSFQYDRKIYSIILGTYLMFDKYATQLGFPNRLNNASSGCGALIMFPNGDLQHFDNLEMGVDYVRFLRSKR